MIGTSRRALVHPQLMTRRIVAPDPNAPSTEAVLSYVRAVQTVDRVLAARQGDPAQAAAVEEKRALVDLAIARQVQAAGRRIGPHRQEALATLQGIFALGQAPGTPLDGLYAGTLISSCIVPPLDAVSRMLPHLWMPWLGKRFHAAAAGGDNMFVGSARWVGRLFWPRYSAYQPFRDGQVTAFPFATRQDPGVQDPAQATLKLDYDLPGNPSFLIRAVLDELVQLSNNYYLGKVHLRLPTGHYHCIGFFALRQMDE